MRKLLRVFKPFRVYKSYKFFFWSFSEKKLFLKSLFWLTFAKIAIPIFSFKRLQPYLGQVSEEVIFLPKPDQVLKNRQVRVAILRASSVLPFHSQCLVTAICARRLLRDLGCSPRLYLGVAKDKNKKEFQESAGPGLMAHAWVKLGNEWTVGKSETDFTVVKIFA